MNASSTASVDRKGRLGLLTEPAGYVDGQNLYQYVKGNPVDTNDPSGLKIPDEDRPPGSGIGVGGGAERYKPVTPPRPPYEPKVIGVLPFLYTGDLEPTEEAYRQGTTAAGERLYYKSPVRGGSLSIGKDGRWGKIPGANGRLAGGASITGGWSMDDGFKAGASGGLGLRGRSRDSNTGRFTSGFGGIGGSATWSQANGFSSDFCLSVGSYQNGSIYSGGANIDSNPFAGSFQLGINYGILNLGLDIDSSYGLGFWLDP